MAAKAWIIFHELQLLRLKFLIARSGVTRRRFALLARLGALDGDNLSGHQLFLLLRLLFRLFLFGFDLGNAHGIDGAQDAKPGTFLMTMF